jgi:hypothetical protein
MVVVGNEVVVVGKKGRGKLTHNDNRCPAYIILDGFARFACFTPRRMGSQIPEAPERANRKPFQVPNNNTSYSTPSSTIILSRGV